MVHDDGCSIVNIASSLHTELVFFVLQLPPWSAVVHKKYQAQKYVFLHCCFPGLSFLLKTKEAPHNAYVSRVQKERQIIVKKQSTIP